MGKLSREQLREVEKYLDGQGLTLQPLRDEMIDHLIGDLEARLEQGAAFEVAWDQIKTSIPNDHLKTVQKEIMETIDNRILLPRVFAYLSLVLLLTSTVFKLLHFPLSGVLLLAAFGAIIAALLTSSLIGIFHYREKKGAYMVLGAIVGVALFMVSYSFQILHLPGFAALRTVSVVLFVLFFPGLAFYVGAKSNSEENILTYLHKKHSPGIERYLGYLFILAATLSIALRVFGSTPEVANVLLVLVMAGAGLQYFALGWHDHKDQNWWYALGLALAFLCFVLSSLSGLSGKTSVVLATCFYVIAGAVLLMKSWSVVHKKALLLLMLLVSVIFFSFALSNMGLLGPMPRALAFNLPVLALLLTGLIYFIKYPLIKVYMLIAVSNYLMFSYELGWW